MTVVLASTINRYLGLSTDTKPTAPLAGSTFYETDTGLVYLYSGSAWVLGPEGSPWRLSRGNWNFTDDGGATGAFTVFTITGDVMFQVFGICNTALTSGGAATVELGVTGNTAVFIASITATTLIADEIWWDATPTATVEQIDVDGLRTFVVANGQDAILTKAAATLTAGDVDFYCLWRPLSANGLVVAT